MIIPPHNIDALVVENKDGANNESGAMSYVQASCDGHEQYLNECKHSAISKEICTLTATISCLHISSKNYIDM